MKGNQFNPLSIARSVMFCYYYRQQYFILFRYRFIYRDIRYAVYYKTEVLHSII